MAECKFFCFFRALLFSIRAPLNYQGGRYYKTNIPFKSDIGSGGKKQEAGKKHFWDRRLFFHSRVGLPKGGCHKKSIPFKSGSGSEGNKQGPGKIVFWAEPVNSSNRRCLDCPPGHPLADFCSEGGRSAPNRCRPRCAKICTRNRAQQPPKWVQKWGSQGE